MKDVNIDLAQKSYGDMPISMPDKGEPRYPCLYLESDKELNLPKEGTMTVRFKQVSSSESESEKGGERYCCTLEVQEIISVDGEASAPTKKHNNAAEALDAIASALARGRGDEQEPEGEY